MECRKETLISNLTFGGITYSCRAHRDLSNLRTGIILSIRYYCPQGQLHPEFLWNAVDQWTGRTMQWPGQYSYDKFLTTHPSSFIARMPTWNDNILQLPLTFTCQMHSSSICVLEVPNEWVTKNVHDIFLLAPFSDFRTESATPPRSVFQDDIFIFVWKSFFLSATLHCYPC